MMRSSLLLVLPLPILAACGGVSCSSNSSPSQLSEGLWRRSRGTHHAGSIGGTP
jgi:hypothetical protein